MNKDIYERVNCIICDLDSTKPIGSKGKSGITAYSCICTNCGLVYLNPRWDKERYNYFYQYEYDQYYRNNAKEDAEDPKRFDRIKQIIERLNNDGYYSFENVLDIGSGMGYSLEWLDKNNMASGLYAIESSKMCQVNLRNLGVNIISTDVDEPWHLNCNISFDLIIMRHVLEHFLDPAGVLKKVANVLSDGGIVYIAVPDMMYPTGSPFDYFFRVVHTYYFSKETLTVLAKRSNYWPIRVVSTMENQEAKSELFGIFRKSDGSPTSEIKVKVNNYEKQLAALRKYLIKEKLRYPLDLLNKVIRLIKKGLSRLLPQNVKQLIKGILAEKKNNVTK